MNTVIAAALVLVLLLGILVGLLIEGARPGGSLDRHHALMRAYRDSDQLREAVVDLQAELADARTAIKLAFVQMARDHRAGAVSEAAAATLNSLTTQVPAAADGDLAMDMQAAS